MEIAEPPADDLHVEKAHLLENGALLDLAVREVQAAGANQCATGLPTEIARIYADNGRYDRAIEVMKRTVPSYFAVDIPELPRPTGKRFSRKPTGPTCTVTRRKTISIPIWSRR